MEDRQVFSIRKSVGSEEIERVTGWKNACRRCREIGGVHEFDITDYSHCAGIDKEAGLHHVSDCQ